MESQDPKLLKQCGVLSRAWLFATPWTVAPQDPLSMEFPKQEYWNELPFSTLRDLPYPGIESVFLIFCIGRQILLLLHHQGKRTKLEA